jgi:hypothetical protein
LVFTAGASYATAPTYVSAPPLSALIDTTDQTVLTTDAATVFASGVTSVAGVLAQLETGIQAHHVAWGVYQGNTYAVESMTGTVGPTDTTVIELTGVHVLFNNGAVTAGLIHIFA